MADNEVTLQDLRDHLDDVLARVEAGEELSIVKDGVEVGHLVPPARWTPKEVIFARYEWAKRHPVDDRFLADIRAASRDTTDDLDEDLRRMGWEV